MGHAPDSRLFGHIREGAVAVVAEEDVSAAGTGDVEVGMAVIIVLAPGGRNTDAVPEPHAGLFCHVFEGAIALVAVQGTTPKLIDEVDVVEAVAVEIGHGQAAAVVV